MKELNLSLLLILLSTSVWGAPLGNGDHPPSISENGGERGGGDEIALAFRADGERVIRILERWQREGNPFELVVSTSDLRRTLGRIQIDVYPHVYLNPDNQSGERTFINNPRRSLLEIGRIRFLQARAERTGGILRHLANVLHELYVLSLPVGRSGDSIHEITRSFLDRLSDEESLERFSARFTDIISRLEHAYLALLNSNAHLLLDTRDHTRSLPGFQSCIRGNSRSCLGVAAELRRYSAEMQRRERLANYRWAEQIAQIGNEADQWVRGLQDFEREISVGTLLMELESLNRRSVTEVQEYIARAVREFDARTTHYSSADAAREMVLLFDRIPEPFEQEVAQKREELSTLCRHWREQIENM